MDEADLAQQSREHFGRLALQRQLDRMSQGKSAIKCEDCGNPIPEKRRQAMPGCTRCILCQHHYERRPR